MLYCIIEIYARYNVHSRQICTHKCIMYTHNTFYISLFNVLWRGRFYESEENFLFTLLTKQENLIFSDNITSSLR